MRKADITIGTVYVIASNASESGDYLFIPFQPCEWKAGAFDGARQVRYGRFIEWQPTFGMSARRIAETAADRDARVAEQQRIAAEQDAERKAEARAKQDAIELAWGHVRTAVEQHEGVTGVQLRQGWASYGAGEQPELTAWFEGYGRMAPLALDVMRLLGRPLTNDPFRSTAAGPALARLATGLPVDPDDKWSADLRLEGDEELTALATVLGATLDLHPSFT